MKKNLCGIVLVFITIGMAQAAPPPEYKLVWQDDFKEPALDPGKWKPETYKRDSAQLTADAISTGPEGLKIRTYSENGIPHTGFMSTRGHFMATYGYFESLIRFHGVSGEHCAFWLEPLQLGKVIGDLRVSGVETDIVEHRAFDAKGNDIRNMAAFNLHWDGYREYHKTTGFKWLSPSSLDGTWHTYAVLWTPDSYVFYVDDIERWRTSAAISGAPQDIRLTCEVKDGGWSGKIPAQGYGPRATSPYGMDVQWVRLWQKP